MVQRNLLEGSISAYLNPQNIPHKPKLRIQSFMANVYFGSPQRKCSGHGICKIYKAGEEPQLDNLTCSRRTIARVSLLDKGQIRLEVLKSSMSPILRLKQFSGDQFQVEHEFDFSPLFDGKICKKIQSGFYPYKEDHRLICIDF